MANLVANAVKFTSRDGMVSIDVAATTDGARIEVADTGVGIDAAELPHIFERFYRGSRANEARGSGSGLGLAIVRSIVDMHGGGIVVESRVGAGSRFSVSLPRDPRLVGRKPGRRTGRRGVGRRRRRSRRDQERRSPALHGQHAGNFTVRADAGEPGSRTLKRSTYSSGRAPAGAREDTTA